MDSERFKVTQKNPGDGTIQCVVKCLLPASSSQEVINDNLVVTANAIRETRTQPISRSIPVQIRQAVLFVLQPGTLSVTFKKDNRQAVARVLIRGDALSERGGIIDSIDCDSLPMEWRSINSLEASNTFIVELKFNAPREGPIPRGANVTFRTKDGRSASIPVAVLN